MGLHGEGDVIACLAASQAVLRRRRQQGWRIASPEDPCQPIHQSNIYFHIEKVIGPYFSELGTSDHTLTFYPFQVNSIKISHVSAQS